MVSLGLPWIHLDSLGLTWIHLDSHGLTWTHLKSPRLTWIHLYSLGSMIHWTHVDQGKGKASAGERKKGKGSDHVLTSFPTSIPPPTHMHEQNETKSRLGSLPPTSDKHSAIMPSTTPFITNFNFEPKRVFVWLLQLPWLFWAESRSYAEVLRSLTGCCQLECGGPGPR